MRAIPNLPWTALPPTVGLSGKPGQLHIRPVDGLVSQTSSAAVILSASLLGAPASTTQVVASSVVGVGVGRRRYRHVGWGVVRSILLAWVITLPAAALLAALLVPVWRWLP